MRRRLIAVFVALDGLCALASPLLAPALLPSPQPESTYVEIAGMCVEEAPDLGAGLGGRLVDMSFCAGA
ncbi:hypothetical protein [Rubrivirga marina]|uniref:Uncharacterized protein n=1 Tax=Rubrivirga marina TaxID=1196024 RepID=A0A271J272_9BACT|nr:hypothetical protein [Rubrivirga marina]PAP77407.1 hypothetical protein BSZ37_13660 [Rubrivirga marina]